MNGEYKISVMPGTHTISAEKSGYFTSQKEVTILENETIIIDFNLRKLPDLVEFWHFEEGNGTTTVKVEITHRAGRLE